MQDVPAALNRKQLSFSGYMDPTRPAIIDEAHSARVNYETFLFADTANEQLFSGDVVRFCGLLTDPISKQRFRPTVESPYTEHEGVLYYFESESGRDMFERAPEDHRLPGFEM